MQLLGGHHRKALRQVEAHLPAEDRAGAGAGAIGFLDTMIENMSHQIEIGTHGWLSFEVRSMTVSVLDDQGCDCCPGIGAFIITGGITAPSGALPCGIGTPAPGMPGGGGGGSGCAAAAPAGGKGRLEASGWP